MREYPSYELALGKAQAVRAKFGPPVIIYRRWNDGKNPRWLVSREPIPIRSLMKTAMFVVTDAVLTAHGMIIPARGSAGDGLRDLLDQFRASPTSR